MSEKCIAKKLWEKFTPYTQIIGYFIMLGSLLSGMFVCFQFISRVNDALASVGELIDFKSQTQTSIAVMQQEVHDLHELLCKGRCK